MGRRKVRLRTVAILALAMLASGGAAYAAPLAESGAQAARYEAENAVCQGSVDSNHAGFSGTGFCNTTNAVGAYVEWTVTVATAGTATLAFRHANGTTANRPLDIAVNGNAARTGVAFNATGAWSTWQTVTTTVSLPAGASKIRATATTSNGAPNLDYLEVEGAAADTQPPTTPGAPRCPADQIGETSVHLHWGASSDNVGVAAYDIYHDGNKFAEAAGNQTEKNLTGLTPNTEYRITVFARDAAGNVSDSSATAVCRTKASSDTQPPTAPSGLSHSNVTQTSVDLTWSAATDDRGVTRYDIRNSGNTVLHSVTGSPPATSTKVTGLSCDTSYTLHVVARDAAGNTSPASNTRSFTTTACSRGTPQTPTTVATGWTIPWDISWLPDGKSALVTERDNFRVWRVTLSGQKTLVGAVPNSQTTGGEGGLMGVAVSPTWNGTTDRDVFFMHTSTDNNRIVKMSFDGSSLSGYTVLLNGIRKNRYHNGGRIAFGPDGYLYATAGDAQQGSLAQDRNSLNGKILRITKTGAAAPGNPFGTRIYSYGHRNPQGLAWDSAGRLWSSELGNSSADELNLILPGRNYGWPTCEGNCSVDGMENPKKTFSVSTCSPSGIAIVNDTVYMTALRGQRLWRIELNGTSAGATSSYFVGTYGRLRAVEKVPGASAIWFGTTNADNNGGQPDGSDRILRSDIR